MIFVFSFIILLGVLVFVHELGHFMAARSIGVRVEKFYIGYNLFGLGIKKMYKGKSSEITIRSGEITIKVTIKRRTHKTNFTWKGEFLRAVIFDFSVIHAVFAPK